MVKPVLLQNQPGVLRGRTPAVSAGRYYDTNLIRWKAGMLRPVGGWERLTPTPMASSARKIFCWADNAQGRWAAFFCDQALLALQSDTFIDIAPADLVFPDTDLTNTGYGTKNYDVGDYGTPRLDDGSPSLALGTIPYTFTMYNWGQQLVTVSSADGRLLYWDPSTPATRAAAVTGAPVANRGCVVTPERHIILFGAAGEPRKIAWCSQENYNDWDFASLTNTAGYLDIDCRGPILAGCVVREGVLLLTQADAWLMRYVGTPYIYSVERIGEADGPASPLSLAPYAAGKAAWFGYRGFWVYDGGYIKALPTDVFHHVWDSIDPTYAPFRIAGADNGLWSEIWWHYPSTGQRENDRYVIWNYEEGWWSIGTMGRTALAPAGVFLNPLMTGADNHVYLHESGWTDAGRVRQVYAETGPMPLSGEPAHIGQIMTDTGAPESTALTIYGRMTPDGAETTFGPYTPRADGYCDTRADARELRLRVEETAAGDWTIGRMYASIRPRGGR